MDKRTLLAIALMLAVFIVVPRFFPSPQPTKAPAADSTHIDTVQKPATQPTPNAPAAAAAAAPAPVRPPTKAVAAETLSATTSHAIYRFTTAGAAPIAVDLQGYPDLRPGHRNGTTGVTLAQPRSTLLAYRLATPRDTVALDTVAFAQSRSGNTTTFTSPAPPVTISYETTPDGYVTKIRGTAPAGASLLVDLPHSLATSEADTLDDVRHLAYAYRIRLRDVTSVPFSKLGADEVRADTGAVDWVSVRDKYFLIALVKPADIPAATFRGIAMAGGPRVNKLAPFASATAVMPVVGGRFGFDLYTGPQSWAELHALGDDLENVNPYAGWFHGIVQPFATIVMRILLWMKASLRVNYGWVLVIFGLAVRIILWPLNQKAMRTSIQMQRLQPELQDVQKRYAKDPEKQREAIMKLYQSHGMSPFSPLMGCLPMLLPMPVLFALYFVFQNTIEFRGVSFLWLPDLSLRDPLFITPIVMGASMFLLSWIGMKSAPPNPQAKMMTYMMPAMFTVMFLNFASGLNLYYAVQNVAAFPQQWMLARERQRSAAKT